MKQPGKILFINLGILLVYMVIINLIASQEHDEYGLAVVLYSSIAIGLHALANLIMSIVSFVGKDKGSGAGFLISAFMVALIGCAGCFASIM